MTTRKIGTSSAGRSRATTPVQRNVPCRVWSECSVTVNLGDNQFIKFVHGYELTAPNESDAAIKRTEEKIYRTCEEVVNRRTKKLRRILKQIEAAG